MVIGDRANQSRILADQAGAGEGGRGLQPAYVG